MAGLTAQGDGKIDHFLDDEGPSQGTAFVQVQPGTRGGRGRGAGDADGFGIRADLRGEDGLRRFILNRAAPACIHKRRHLALLGTAGGGLRLR